MRLKLRTRVVKDVAIIDATGGFTLGEDTQEFRDRVEELADAGFRKILINLAAVSYMDSSALGELTAACTSFRKEGGDVKLLHLTKRTIDLLMITKLVTLFEVFEDEDAGVESFYSMAHGAAVGRHGRRFGARDWRRRLA